ncbi:MULTISPECIES: hypothetical protein [Cyanophyceae]|uniref:Uncharacterized protein n=1 Tax=Leptolyngbya subtilissima DQ-A4 TaxID=2933933 RepID=A0ABV0KBG1_9CYAN|nr:hypothetical protein [Nodosilinea sp. FACHB-141]MBD2114163.1 hypothetical protein [Nodosilinea sp. FACHB-141]
MGTENDEYKAGLRKRVKLTNPEQLYDVQDGNGSQIPYDLADGRQLFNHYRHRMTNYDQVLDQIRSEQQGQITGRQEKQVAVAAAENILQKYRDEHVKVIQDSQKKGQVLKSLFEKAGVSTASALSQLLDSWSEKIKQIGHLENSQRSLQTWNDTYRVQRELVKAVLKQENASKEIQEKVKLIYSTKSSNKAIELGSDLFNIEKSEILKLVKTVVHYTKL